jgi:hypothetical protein
MTPPVYWYDFVGLICGVYLFVVSVAYLKFKTDLDLFVRGEIFISRIVFGENYSKKIKNLRFSEKAMKIRSALYLYISFTFFLIFLYSVSR